MKVYDGVDIEVYVSKSWIVRFVTASGVICLAPKELIDITDAVAQHLEIKSAAEYIDELFTEEDLEAGRQAITEYIESIPCPSINEDLLGQGGEA